MTDTLTGLPTQAHARSTDGDTSHAAAASVTNLTAKQTAVLTILRTMQTWPDPRTEETPYADGMTHPQIVRWYRYAIEQGHTRTFPAQTDQSIRSRCAELVAAGLVVDSGKRVKLDTGRNAKVWAVAPAGEQ